MKMTLHNYQCDALSFQLSRSASGLFLDPGLGKTAISLAVANVRIRTELSCGALIVAPLNVCRSSWPRQVSEWDNFGNLKVVLLHGEGKFQRLWQPADIYCINPEGLKALHAELLRGLKRGNPLPFDSLIVDESTKFKNPTGERFKLLKDMLPLFKYRSILTGTPAPKNLMDLWAQIFILDNGAALGDNFYKFRKQYFYTEDWNQYDWKPKDFALETITEKIRHLVLNMSAEKYIDMPELVTNPIEFTLPGKVADMYNELQNEMAVFIQGEEVTAEAAAQLSMRMRQFASGRVYEDIPEELDEKQRAQFMKTRKVLFAHGERKQALSNLVDELNGKPLLIAYTFKHELETLLDLFGEDVPHIGSGIKAEVQTQIEDDWNAGKLPILLGNPASMAHGLNLQKGGSDICWFTPTWDLELFIQFNTRIYRQGAVGKQVRIHILTALGTIDELMLERLKDKGINQSATRANINGS